MKRFLLAALALFLAMPAPAYACAAPVSACARPVVGAVPLISPGELADVAIDANEGKAVQHAAAALRSDIRAVAGPRERTSRTTIIAGTLGNSATIDRLARSGKLSLAGLAGQWEGYVEQVVDRPLPGVERALVIAGADRRGTVFGLYDVSAKIGVSPWHYWADVPPFRHDRLWITPGRVADHPVVRYRGIFLNDEDPALGGWARATFGWLSRRFYEKVYDLILRQKANFLWPAMWGKSIWEDDPSAAPLADEMGVVLGTSHHEPLGRAHVDWERHGKGPWDYTTNADNLRAFWREGMRRRGTAETLVTIGMRGDGDEPMTRGTAIGLLERIVAAQRRIIEETTGHPAADTPQVWALYKEVQDYYDQGMRVPDDVTLLFSDDNWGNLRRLPDPSAPPRRGGYGIYYHFDYVGGPRNYKWIDTNNLPRVWQQMRLAHGAGADRLWIVNVGDLKPMELPISFFLDMAWNPDRMSAAAMTGYPAAWAVQQFGARDAAAIGDALARYGQLAARRKPELLDANSYSPAEWRDLVGRWSLLEQDARRLAARVAPDRRDAFYELVLHRIEAMANLHRLYQAVALNWQAAAAGDLAEAAREAASARRFFANDAAIRHRYEGSAGGKWPQMMAQTHIGYAGWQQPDTDIMPALWSPGMPRPARPAGAPARTVLLDATAPSEVRSGRGFSWSRIPRLGPDDAASIAEPANAAAIEHPGGDSPRLLYRFRARGSGPGEVRVTAAPGLDTSGRGHLRYAVSVDGDAPIIVDLLAGETERSWGAAVADNRRVGVTSVALTPGEHQLSVWLVDPAIVIQRVSVAR